MTTCDTIPFLSETTLAALEIETSDVVETIEALIHGSANDTVWSAPKAVILPSDGRYMMAALAAMDNPSLLAVKTVVLNPRNPDRGLPQINGLVTMLDSDTGLPVAILDGNWITAVRTAGLSAVAAKYMANESSAVCGFIGCGVQAQSHLTAFSDLFPLEHLKIFGRGQANIDLLCARADQLNLSYELCETSREAAEHVDLLVTSVTFSAQFSPPLDAGWLAPGCFVAMADLGGPWDRDSFSAADQLVVDDLEQEAALPNKLAHADDITGDLAGLVLGRFNGRNAPSDRTAFVFRGHALGDLALASLAYQRFKAG